MSFTTYIYIHTYVWYSMHLSDNATETERQQINRQTKNTKKTELTKEEMNEWAHKILHK